MSKKQAKEARAMTIVEVVQAAEEIRTTFGILLAVKWGEGKVCRFSGFVERRCDDSEASLDS